MKEGYILVTNPVLIEFGSANVPVRIRCRIVHIQATHTIIQVVVAITETNGYRREGAALLPCYCCSVTKKIALGEDPQTPYVAA